MQASAAKKTDNRMPLQSRLRLLLKLCCCLGAPLLALAMHRFATTKAHMSGGGPGLHIALMNDRTVRAQYLWHTVEPSRWLFVAYAVFSLAAWSLLSLVHVSPTIRLMLLLVISLPALWYSREMLYLGGKLLSLM